MGRGGIVGLFVHSDGLSSTYQMSKLIGPDEREGECDLCDQRVKSCESAVRQSMHGAYLIKKKEKVEGIQSILFMMVFTDGTSIQ